MNRADIIDVLLWQSVPAEVTRLVKLAAGTYQVIADILPSLPQIQAKIYYNPDKETALLIHPDYVDSEKSASYWIALKQIPGIEHVEQSCVDELPVDEPYMLVKRAEDGLPASSVFRPIGQLAGWQPSTFTRAFGGPSPLSATIGGGLLGSAVGYGAGWLSEKLLPSDKFESGKLRRTLAILGGLAGAAPGVWQGADLAFRDENVNNRGVGAFFRGFPWNNEKPAADNRFKAITDKLASVFPSEVLMLSDMWKHAAFEAGADHLPMIPVDEFGRTIWSDISTMGGYTSPQIASASTGVIQAASLARGGATIISPADIARIGVGMGSGYLSSLLVGKTLGALAGLTPSAQKALQQQGVFAGVLSNVIPLLFRQ
jgi:hypothetical protein